MKVAVEYPIENKTLAKKIASTHCIDYSGIVKEELYIAVFFVITVLKFV